MDAEALLYTHRKNALSRRCGSKSVATADRGNLQVQAGVLRMAAFVHDRCFCLVAGNNGDKLVVSMRLTEVRTKTALTVRNLHKNLHSIRLEIAATPSRCLAKHHAPLFRKL